jgi:hypothetical protein
MDRLARDKGKNSFYSREREPKLRNRGKISAYGGVARHKVQAYQGISGKTRHGFVTHYRDKNSLPNGQKVNFRINSTYGGVSRQNGQVIWQ